MARLIGANFGGADLSHATLRSVYLGYTNMTGTNLWRADFRGAFLYKALLVRANLIDALLKGAVHF